MLSHKEEVERVSRIHAALDSFAEQQAAIDAGYNGSRGDWPFFDGVTTQYFKVEEVRSWPTMKRTMLRHVEASHFRHLCVAWVDGTPILFVTSKLETGDRDCAEAVSRGLCIYKEMIPACLGQRDAEDHMGIAGARPSHVNCKHCNATIASMSAMRTPADAGPFCATCHDVTERMEAGWLRENSNLPDHVTGVIRYRSSSCYETFWLVGDTPDEKRRETALEHAASSSWIDPMEFSRELLDRLWKERLSRAATTGDSASTAGPTSCQLCGCSSQTNKMHYMSEVTALCHECNALPLEAPLARPPAFPDRTPRRQPSRHDPRLIDLDQAWSTPGAES